jgi:hypothetical protein
MTTALRAIDAPDLQPLRNSAEFDAFEAEFKALIMQVFNDTLRPLERQVNVSGMPHLGNTELIERTLKDWGLAIVRRDATRTAFLLKAARARNPRRGLIFLKQYLQSVWPGVWKVEPLWHPIATSANYPADRRPLADTDLGNNFEAVYDPEGNEDVPDVFVTDWQGRSQLFSFARTNLFTGSEFPSATAYWGRVNCTITPNASVAPDGTNTAALVTRTAAGNHYIWQNFNDAAPQGKVYAMSVWMRSGTLTGDVRVWLKDSAGLTIGATYATLGLGWTRVTVLATVPLTAASGYVNCVIDPINDTGAAGDTFYVWGAQLERDRISRYIKTVGAAVTTTDFTVDAQGTATFNVPNAPPPAALTMFRTGRVRVTLPVSIDNGLGLLEITKAFRSTLAARLMLELQLSTVFENLGAAEGGLAVANGASGVMPFMAIGKLTR